MGRYLRVALAVVAIGAAALLRPLIASPRENAAAAGARDVLVVARDMTYYVDGGATPNPSLQFKPGELITLTFRNEDAGMEHDFGIPAWGHEAPRRQGAGRHCVSGARKLHERRLRLYSALRNDERKGARRVTGEMGTAVRLP